MFLRVFPMTRRQRASAGLCLPRSFLVWGSLGILVVSLGASPLGAQQGPIRLFPDQLGPAAPTAPGGPG